MPYLFMARILLVDDAEPILDATGTVLRILGHEVVTVMSGDDGVAEFRKKPFDVVITDMRMPGLSGRDVITALRQIDPEVRIIVSEGSISAHPLGSGDAAGQLRVDGHLQKPYTADKLTAEIAKALASPRSV